VTSIMPPDNAEKH